MSKEQKLCSREDAHPNGGTQHVTKEISNINLSIHLPTFILAIYTARVETVDNGGASIRHARTAMDQAFVRMVEKRANARTVVDQAFLRMVEKRANARTVVDQAFLRMVEKRANARTVVEQAFVRMVEKRAISALLLTKIQYLTWCSILLYDISVVQ